jgi:hypothetical protein
MRIPKIPGGLIRRIALLSCSLPAAVLAAKPEAAVELIDAGTYHVAVTPDRQWTTKTDRTQGYVVFNYSDTPGRENALATATIGLFRSVVPVAARSAKLTDLAAAYAANDVAGARQTLFKSLDKLALASQKPEVVNGGSLFNFLEAIDATYSRTSSTRFVRASVYFPPTFSENGVLFLLIGRETFDAPTLRPDKLEKMRDLVRGIR